MSTIQFEDFTKVDLRVGTILEVNDFGEFGLKKTSAQITQLYTVEHLIGKQVVAVINFPPKQIANLMSECLILGGLGDNKEVILIAPDRKVANGTKIG